MHNLLFYYLFCIWMVNAFMRVEAYVHYSFHGKIRGQFVGMAFFLPKRGSMGCRSGPQPWRQVFLPTELSQKPHMHSVCGLQPTCRP